MTSPAATRKVTAYIRVSTSQQANEGVSLEAQKARAHAWAIANDLELDGVHADAGLSGKRADNRPALQDAIREVCANKGVLLVYSLSRLARSTKDTITIAEGLEKAGADLVSLSEKIDTTSASGKMIFRLLAVMSEFERDQVAERTRAALAHKKARGEHTGGHVPFGFRLDADGVHLLEDTHEQEVLTRIHSLRAEGFSYRGIGEELQNRGILTRSGKAWNPKVLRDLCLRQSA